MAKEEMLEFPGVVTELLPNATFRVKLENQHESSPTRRDGCARTALGCLRRQGSGRDDTL